MKQTELSRLLGPLLARKPGLKPTSVWDAALDERIAAAPIEDFGRAGGSERPYALAVKSGLHLWNDSLNLSHELSQDIHNATGSYWHGIMHRMEGDYWNAKYWFRQVGRHESFNRLTADAGRIWAAWQDGERAEAAGKRMTDVGRLCSGNSWDPYLFVDLVEEALRFGGSDSAVHTLLLELQRAEFAALLSYSAAHSGGGLIIESTD